METLPVSHCQSCFVCGTGPATIYFSNGLGRRGRDGHEGSADMIDAEAAFELYRLGHLTPVGLASELFGLIDSSNIEGVMRRVPSRAGEKLRSLAVHYRPGGALRLNVDSPEATPENAVLIREWFACHPQEAAEAVHQPPASRAKVVV